MFISDPCSALVGLLVVYVPRPELASGEAITRWDIVQLDALTIHLIDGLAVLGAEQQLELPSLRLLEAHKALRFVAVVHPPIGVIGSQE
jgi:hypothetical protein